MLTHIHIYAHTCASTCMSMPAHIWMCAHIHACACTHTHVHTQKRWMDTQNKCCRCVRLAGLMQVLITWSLALLTLWLNDIVIVFYKVKAWGLGNQVKKCKRKSHNVLSKFVIVCWQHWSPSSNTLWAAAWIILKSLTCYLMDSCKLRVLGITHFQVFTLLYKQYVKKHNPCKHSGISYNCKCV